MKRASFVILGLMLAACEPRPEGEPVLRAELGEDGQTTEIASSTSDDAQAEAPAIASACRSVTFEGTAFTHCIADPAIHTIRTVQAPTSGDNFGTIGAWAEGKDESTIAFAMNAGMYGDDLKAIGYYVEGSERLRELNRADGPGNFHMKPNGVFFGTDGSWQVLDTERFYATIGDRPQFGTQSGPMLVIDGALHPDFQDDGPSRAIRNGVGVTSDGKAHFVISDAPISFGKFGRFFRDELKTPNALFLDGNVSSLWDPASGRIDGRRVGPLLVVETK